MPGIPVAVPVPVAHHDREPDESESLLFSSTSAHEYAEDFVLLDVPEAKNVARAILRAIDRIRPSTIIEGQS